MIFFRCKVKCSYKAEEKTLISGLWDFGGGVTLLSTRCVVWFLGGTKRLRR